MKGALEGGVSRVSIALGKAEPWANSGKSVYFSKSGGVEDISERSFSVFSCAAMRDGAKAETVFVGLLQACLARLARLVTLKKKNFL